MGKVGISEVAEAAEVSEATVSRVINNRGVVSPATRKRVEESIRELGYGRGASHSVVLLITPGLDDPFFAKTSDRLAAALGLQGMQAVVCSAPVDGVQEIEFVAAMVELGISGAVFVSASNTLEGADPAAFRLLESRGVPYVCLNGAFDGSLAPSLSSNDRLAAEVSVAHLWTLGHRRVGLIAGPIGNRPSDRRVDGFAAAMTGRGAGDGDFPVTHRAYSVEGGYAGAVELLADGGVTALVAASDEMAFGAIRAIRRAGKRVPEDVSVIGYDDAHALEFTDPPLTTVRQPVERLSQAVVSALMRLVNKRQVDAGELLFDPELVVRGSTVAPPS